MVVKRENGGIDMKKEELLNTFMEFIEDKFPELIEEEKEKTVFSDGEKYYWIDSDGNVYPSFWENDSVDEGRLLIGNIFKTEEEATFELERLKVLHELQELGRPFKPGVMNFYFTIDEPNDGMVFLWVNSSRCLHFNCYFDSEEEAKKAIEKIGRDRIKKYLFGVEE